ncbi:MAG: SRPBCC family protein [Actinocrinis sp.]
MTHEFEVRDQIEVEATPEQVWEAISTGPGIDSWLMGRNQMDQHEGGRGRMDMGGFVIESTVTTWQPPNHLVYQGDPAPDGSFHAFEYLVEGRAGGSTVVRFVHSGFLGDDWEAEYDGLRKGDPMYLRKLGEYLKYFFRRPSTPVAAFAGETPGREASWEKVHAALGLTAPVALDQRVHLTPAGLPAMDGVVDYVSEDFLGVRTADGLYRFIYGYNGAFVLGHHLFAEPGGQPIDEKDANQAWQAWLGTVFA